MDFTITSMIHDLAAAIIRDGKVPSDWEQSFIVCLYKGKGEALERGNYCGLKLTQQVMKVLERIVDGLIRQLVSVDDSQFGFTPGRGTTDAIFVVRQLQEKYLVANKRLYMAFLDLEKAFDQVPWKVIWWARENLVLLQVRHNEKEMKVKPATSFKLITIFIHQNKIRQDSKQKNVSKQYLSRF